ncbi:MAG: glycosyltransferase family 2 protein [Selenomonadaceae bacterium]|nr:glycosyltransferase family 2 protein [Selenomonadaceae bacterium]
MKSVAIVVPVYNEEDNIEHFAASASKVMDALSYEYEILFVDDGSKDKSREILLKLERENPHISAIFLARNFGHQLALTCGLDHADADAVITMDGDMQHPPELIPKLISMWEDGYEVVQTIRETTEGVSFFKKTTSKYYYSLLNAISDVPIQPGGSDFRLMDRKVVEAFRLYPEHARFIRGMIGAMGFRQAKLSFVAPPRFAGVSKFSIRKMAHFAMDGILAYSSVPLRWAFYMGIFSGFCSLILLIHVFYETWLGNAVAGWATITVCILFFGGMQMVFLGIIGEYIGRIFEETKRRPLYLIGKEAKKRGGET